LVDCIYDFRVYIVDFSADQKFASRG